MTKKIKASALDDDLDVFSSIKSSEEKKRERLPINSVDQSLVKKLKNRVNVFFYVSSQNFHVTGGVGTFFCGFAEMAQHWGWRITVILDQKLNKNGEKLRAKFINNSIEYFTPEGQMDVVDIFQNQYSKTFDDSYENTIYLIKSSSDVYDTENNIDNEYVIDLIHSKTEEKIICDKEIHTGLKNFDHTKFCSFSKERMNIGRIFNFECAQKHALRKTLPTFIISNNPESNYTIVLSGIHQFFPTLFYSHLDHSVHYDATRSIVPFHDSFIKALHLIQGAEKIQIATQTKNNKKIIEENLEKIFSKSVITDRVIELPHVIDEEIQTEIDFDSIKQEGVLFTGRYEPRKNPKAFVRLIKASKLIPKILTNKTGKLKFIKDFKDNDLIVEDGDNVYFKNENENININELIKAGISGKEKFDFIRSAKVAFHPSGLESFGYSAFESLHFCKTFLLKFDVKGKNKEGSKKNEKVNWYKNFEDFGVSVLDEKDEEAWVTAIKAAHDEPSDPKEYFTRMMEYHRSAYCKWLEYVSKIQIKKEEPFGLRSAFAKELTNAKINNSHVVLEKFFSKLRKDSKNIAWCDIESVCNALPWCDVIYDNNETKIKLREDVIIKTEDNKKKNSVSN